MEYRDCNQCEIGNHDKCQVMTIDRINIICTCEKH